MVLGSVTARPRDSHVMIGPTTELCNFSLLLVSYILVAGSREVTSGVGAGCGTQDNDEYDERSVREYICSRLLN